MIDELLALDRTPLDPRVREACAAALVARGDPRGRFLALDAELAGTPTRAPRPLVYRPTSKEPQTEFGPRQTALDELARTLDPAWLARVGALSHRRMHPWRPPRRPGEPPTMLPGALREVDLKPPPARLALDNVAATLLQSLRWALPGPVTEIAVHGGGDEWNAWVYPIYWCTRPPGRDTDDRPQIVELRVPPPDRLRAIRLIREITGCNLRTARDRLDQPPCVLLETHDDAQVEAMIDRVAAAGGQAAVRGEDLPPGETPVLAEGVSLLEAGDPTEVVLRADAEGLEVRKFAIRWTHPHKNERAHVLRARWLWSELPADPAERIEAVRPTIEAVVAERRASFVACRLCHRLTPPEWRFGPDACSSCAEKHLGVVY
ncbi:hypothetical protein OV203_07835 [Nannocystis sp. ILAH1]|uniref:ribosomal protein L7/L12 n=1 Tax=unclassified Nannocystis TaxID=2627009 RepID=UPI00226F7D2D|nr:MULTISPECIES: hypothetical protein [unclassified Nannocystis]MCY0987028.1 hypothetical protein [Nannocystis sp. ILAH1]MCY1071911.1 hypothetical protein [Nannocystis sp. RBIL2]